MEIKISFEDGSFICLDKSTREDKILTISMCGINGNKTTMSSSDLDMEQVEELIKFMQRALE